MKRLFIIGLCAVLLLSFAGCTGNTPEQPTNGTTGATTVTTTVTTTAPTTTTEATTTTTQPPVTDTALQIGGPTFTLDGVTFELGTSPEKLLAHLGEPKEKKVYGSSQWGTLIDYYYEGIEIRAHSAKDIDDADFDAENLSDQVIGEVYICSDAYIFDGIRVGMTVEQLEEQLATTLSSLKVEKRRKIAGVLHGGACYWLRKSGEEQYLWSIIFPECDPPFDESGEVRILPGSTVECIYISYPFYQRQRVN